MVTGAENVVPREPFRAKTYSKMPPNWLLWEPLGAKMVPKGGKRAPRRGSVSKKVTQ